MFTRWLPLAWGLAAALVGACGDDASPGSGTGGSSSEGAGKGGAGGSGGASASGTGGSSGAGVSGGSSSTCNGITGTYAIVRTRSKSNPGSCPPDYSYNPSIPGKVTADSKSASGFKFEIGYSTKSGEIGFVECTNNVSECSIFATCKNQESTLVDQVALDVDANSISGTLARIVKNQGDCTVNFELSGLRQ